MCDVQRLPLVPPAYALLIAREGEGQADPSLLGAKMDIVPAVVRYLGYRTYPRGGHNIWGIALMGGGA